MEQEDTWCAVIKPIPTELIGHEAFSAAAGHNMYANVSKRLKEYIAQNLNSGSLTPLFRFAK